MDTVQKNELVAAWKKKRDAQMKLFDAEKASEEASEAYWRLLQCLTPEERNEFFRYLETA